MSSFLFVFMYMFMFLNSPLCYFIFICWFTFIFILKMPYFYCSLISYDSMLFDELSLFMSIMLFMVFYIIYYVNFSSSNFYNSFSNAILMFSCFVVFNTSNMLILFLMFEFSVLPISYMILKWGIYPDRSKGVLLMFLFTLVFSLPFLILFMLFYLNNNSWDYIFYINNFSSLPFLTSLFCFICFSVKLPLLGVHYWLPVAHVEAPTFGSMILAGVLLKLGGVGLYRMSSLIDISVIMDTLLFYLLFSMVFSGVLCFIQNDYKKLIAFSSIFHMSMIPILVISSNLLSFKSFILIMFTHGIISPGLFYIVSLLVSMYSSRQLLLIRGVYNFSPLFFSLICIFFLFTLPAPPMLSFYAEFISILSIFNILPNIMFFILMIYLFMALLYNLNWLMSFFSPSDSDLSLNKIWFFSFFDFILLFLLIIFLMVFLFLIFIL